MRAESSGCRNERRRARAFPVLPCAFPALRGFAPRRGAGTVRNAWRRSSRPALRVPRAAQGIRWRACSAAPCKKGARAVPRRVGTVRGAACNRNDRRRMGILAKARDDTMWRAWAARSGEER